jgi:hypothetical protein
MRTLAAVMLRRLINTGIDENWANLGDDKKNALKQELLVAVQHESDSNMRKKITDVIAELARFLIEDQTDGQNLWPEVLTFLFEMSSSANIAMKECALNLFT